MRDLKISDDKKQALKNIVDSKMMTREEAATMIGVSPSQITAGIRNGTLPIGAVLENNRTIVSVDRFAKWVKGCDMCVNANKGVCQAGDCT